MKKSFINLLICTSLIINIYLPQIVFASESRQYTDPFTYMDSESDTEVYEYDDSIIINDSLEGEENCREKNSDIVNKDTPGEFSSKEHSWFFKPNSEGLPPEQPQAVIEFLKKYSGYYLGNTSHKELYITFDEGYENGYTEKILDILKNNDVKAAFFVVKPYIKSNPEIIKRMVSEGHLVCNHSAHHPSMASIKNFDKFKTELEEVEKCYEEVTGEKMPKFFRPPMGRYSELSLNYTKNLGYKSIFWSLAYYDWDVKKQPTESYALEKLTKRTHNGCILLLHAVSKTNAAVLDGLIKVWKAAGYEFKTLNDLPEQN